MSGSRRPSISIYDYPEHLNPFNDETANIQVEKYREGKDSSQNKRKFWTFGRSRKRSSNSFSIKSTWNGLFGKRKDISNLPEKRSTITTVSSTYKTEAFEKPVAAQRYSKDQQDFDEAFGTLARRRKYTFDNSSRYSSTLTVNGDPARIYDGSPQNTTTSIMGDITPKAPARRFGQVSPRPTDKIPPLDYAGNDHKKNGNVASHDDKSESTPVPPLRRFANRSSQRINAHSLDSDEVNRPEDVTLRDENENIPEDYVFKRFNQDAVRRSNLSINSCMSVTSVVSTSGRKKRRAPQPPKPIQQLNTSEENEEKPASTCPAPTTTTVELQITEPIDIETTIKKIDELTTKNSESDSTPTPTAENAEQSKDDSNKDASVNICATHSDSLSTQAESSLPEIVADEHNEIIPDQNTEIIPDQSTEIIADQSTEIIPDQSTEIIPDQNTVIVADESTETVSASAEDIDINEAASVETVDLERANSSNTVSRSNSFSVKEEIEKIEKQIKALETKNAEAEDTCDEVSNTRQSIQANRRNFFQDMVDEDSSGTIKIEIKELPREQKDIHVVRLTDPPVPTKAPREAVRVIELHISEPIRQTPELLDDVNPIPKPRRHNSLSLNNCETTYRDAPERGFAKCDKRGKSF